MELTINSLPDRKTVSTDRPLCSAKKPMTEKIATPPRRLVATLIKGTPTASLKLKKNILDCGRI